MDTMFIILNKRFASYDLNVMAANISRSITVIAPSNPRHIMPLNKS
jgi:hypothetical protein